MLNSFKFVFLFIISLHFITHQQLTPKTQDYSLLSLPESISGWTLKGEPESYRGDDLFLYINGGADIFHEYGFKEVISSEYLRGENGRISVEIYRMKNPFSAFGIFSFKTGGKWETSPGGHLFNTEDYYLNLLLGDCLVTITSININKQTAKGIEIIQNELEKTISSPVVYPEILKYINPERYKSRIFFKGDLSLMNIYNFFSAESGIAHGVSGMENERKLIILKFRNGENPAEMTGRFFTNLRNEKRYSGFITGEGTLHFTDSRKRSLLLQLFNDFLMIHIGKTLSECTEEAEKTKRYILSYK